VARFGENRNAHQLLVVKPEGKRPLRRPRCRWRILLKVGWGGGIITVLHRQVGKYNYLPTYL